MGFHAEFIADSVMATIDVVLCLGLTLLFVLPVVRFVLCCRCRRRRDRPSFTPLVPPSVTPPAAAEGGASLTK